MNNLKGGQISRGSKYFLNTSILLNFMSKKFLISKVKFF